LPLPLPFTSDSCRKKPVFCFPLRILRTPSGLTIRPAHTLMGITNVLAVLFLVRHTVRISLASSTVRSVQLDRSTRKKESRNNSLSRMAYLSRDCNSGSCTGQLKREVSAHSPLEC